MRSSSSNAPVVLILEALSHTREMDADTKSARVTVRALACSCVQMLKPLEKKRSMLWWWRLLWPPKSLLREAPPQAASIALYTSTLWCVSK